MQQADLHRLAVDALRARGLLDHFAPQALAEAEALRRQGPRAQRGALRDLRALAWFSIDNDDTRDLDQLSWAEPLPGDGARLLVAVADVEAFVVHAGAIDSHAAANTTSVYTAAGVFPMLPLALSTDLSSLHEGQDRLAVVVDMQLDAEGMVTASTLYQARVHNHARLTYNDVAAWMDDPAHAAPGLAAALARVPELEAQLRLHERLADRLRRQRVRRGALSVRTTQARPVFDDAGQLVDLRPDEKNRAMDLIADLMIAANSATARFLAQQKFPSLRRMLSAPRRWDRIVALAASHGVTLPPQPDALALDHFLAERRAADPAGFNDLSLTVIKSLGSGEYAAEQGNGNGGATGHFGLAVADYAHSTAPNRRFPDLVTQRLLKAALAGEPPPYDAGQLALIARHCTLQEDNANKVERQVLKAAAALLLHARIGEVFDAIVTGASPKGTFVRIARPMVEGRLVRGLEGADVGDALRVRLLQVSAELGHLDFERV
ncbi:RNB domain-containing ribonuclease [Aquabacterium humicola]|uniref:RNB domain-containing ribonuclease n=1 Tax=Aquabacterium humicola TaxID=3237377 RepID=UPI002542ABC8|nr:RNB domain-containing ribonuclease [Rubrivivax pictus]